MPQAVADQRHTWCGYICLACKCCHTANEPWLYLLMPYQSFCWCTHSAVLNLGRHARAMSRRYCTKKRALQVGLSHQRYSRQPGSSFSNSILAHVSAHCVFPAVNAYSACFRNWNGCACQVNMAMNECAYVRACMSALPQVCCNAGPQMRWPSG